MNKKGCEKGKLFMFILLFQGMDGFLAETMILDLYQLILKCAHIHYHVNVSFDVLMYAVLTRHLSITRASWLVPVADKTAFISLKREGGGRGILLSFQLECTRKCLLILL